MSKTKKKAPVNKKHVALLICLILLVYGGLGYTFYLSWLDSQPVFRDVTVELGTESLGLRSFLTDAAIPERAAFVSDPSVIDLGKVGTTEILVRHGNTESTVKLTVQDTTAPTATAAEPQTVPVDGVLPGGGAGGRPRQQNRAYLHPVFHRLGEARCDSGAGYPPDCRSNPDRPSERQWLCKPV